MKKLFKSIFLIKKLQGFKPAQFFIPKTAYAVFVIFLFSLLTASVFADDAGLTVSAKHPGEGEELKTLDVENIEVEPEPEGGVNITLIVLIIAAIIILGLIVWRLFFRR